MILPLSLRKEGPFWDIVKARGGRLSRYIPERDVAGLPLTPAVARHQIDAAVGRGEDAAAGVEAAARRLNCAV